MAGPLIYLFPPFIFDARSGHLSKCGDTRPLRAKTLAVLGYLLDRCGRLVSKEELLRAVWPGINVSKAVLTVCISELRQALEDERLDARFIETAHGRGYRFIAPVTTQSEGPLQRSETGTKSPIIIGRQTEMASLREVWDLVKGGAGRMVLITGEAGIGKSALAERFVSYLQEFHAPLVGRSQCVDLNGKTIAYHPFLEAISELRQGKEGHRIAKILRRHAPGWLVHLPGLLNEAEEDALRFEVGQPGAAVMSHQVSDALKRIGTLDPVLLFFDDLHLGDESTLDLLERLVTVDARILILATCRENEAHRNADALKRFIATARGHGILLHIRLQGLTEAELAEYLRRRLSTSVIGRIAGDLHRLTGGNALFMRSIVDRMERQDETELDGFEFGVHLPTVTHFIQHQARQLAPKHRQLLETASVIGNTFSTAALAAGLEGEANGWGEDFILDLCDRCSDSDGFIRPEGIVRWPDGTVSPTYRLRHDLHREALYQQIPIHRRREIHLKIARRLETGFVTQTYRIADELAMHFERAGKAEQAAGYLRMCAENELSRSGTKAAVAHAEQALNLLDSVRSPNNQLRAALELIRANGLMSSIGFAAPEVADAFQRARLLLPGIQGEAEQMPTLLGLAKYYLVRRNLSQALAMARRSLCAAESAGDESVKVAGEMTIGATYYAAADYLEALEHMERVARLFNPQRDHAHPLLYGLDSAAAAKAYAGLCLWRLGYPDKAKRAVLEAEEVAQEVGHANTIAMAMTAVAEVYFDCRDIARLRLQAERLMSFCADRDLQFWHGWGRYYHGQVLALKGLETEAVFHLRQGIAELAASAADVELARCLSIPIEVAAGALTRQDGLRTILDSIHAMSQVRNISDAGEIYRIAGSLQVDDHGQPVDCDGAEGAEAFLRRAISHARRRKAKSFELRAAIDLSRILLSQSRTKEVRHLIGPLHGWFKEGFGTRDLRAAKALADSLS